MTPRELTSPAEAARALVDLVGHEIALAIPIGIGKPNRLVNALYEIAKADPTIRLKIYTGLTLVRPAYRSDLERRFVAPLLDRLFPTWPDLAYAEAMRNGGLPPNVEVHEFFLQAGQWLSNDLMQQSYASISYSHVAGNLQRFGVNVLAQLVAPQPDGRTSHLSLASNTDIALDMTDYVAAQRRHGTPIAVVGEINSNLPYMPGVAEVQRGEFDILLDEPRPHYDLFAPPKERVPLTDHAMALHAATLVKDGGTLQIGIGAFADALCHALILRHTDNATFRDLLSRLGGPMAAEAHLGPFAQGLYGCSEMLVDGFLALRRAGILRRTVDIADPSTDGTAPTVTRDVLLHAGFFLGSRAFYDELRAMPAAELDRIAMSPISFTNTLMGDTAAKFTQRRDARFFNTAMCATLLGAASADQLEDGRVVSGVGGQGDFVAMAHDLPGARSIIAVRSTRQAGRGRTFSNIVWRYANTSMPRQLRDIYVSEYGIADVRGRSDRDVVAAMLSIADSRYQPQLLKEAMRARKLPTDFRLPDESMANSRSRIVNALGSARESGLLPEFPLGSEMTRTEQALLGPLGRLKQASSGQLLGLFARGLTAGKATESEIEALGRLGLARPTDTREQAMMLLVLGAMRSL